MSENERRQKKERLDQRRNVQNEFRRKQAEQFEQLNRDYTPKYPTLPDAVPVSDDEDSTDDDDSIISSDTTDDNIRFEASEGAEAEGVSSPVARRTRTRNRPTISRNSQSLRRGSRVRKPYNKNLQGLDQHSEFNLAHEVDIEHHPEFERCCKASLVVQDIEKKKKSLVTNKMKQDGYIKRSENRQKFYCTDGTKQPPRAARLPRKKRQYKARLARKKLQEVYCTMNQMEWEVPSAERLMQSDLARFVHFAASDCGFNGTVEELAVGWLHPLMLAAKTMANQNDNPTWFQAMNGPFSEEYWQAACIEVETLEQMESWDVVERTDEMNVLPSTWAFKCKRFPDGMIKKFKARFCARGDRQIEGVDFFETFAPVVQWVTIRLMLILECLLGLVSKQGDISCAFLHAHLEENEKVYLSMPQGFKQYDKRGREKVLSMRRSIYGLRQAPRNFWKYMVEKFETVGLKQSDFDPCLFIGDTCIAVIFVDDVLLWSTKEEHIMKVGLDLRAEGVDLEEEDDAAGYLGVKLTKIPETGQMVMTQEGLITRIIEALGLDTDKSTPRDTPCLKAPLSKDLDGDPMY